MLKQDNPQHFPLTNAKTHVGVHDLLIEGEKNHIWDKFSHQQDPEEFRQLYV